MAGISTHFDLLPNVVSENFKVKCTLCTSVISGNMKVKSNFVAHMKIYICIYFIYCFLIQCTKLINMSKVYKKEINMMTFYDLSEFTLYIFMYMYMSCCEFNVHTLFQRKHRDVMYLEHPEQKKMGHR